MKASTEEFLYFLLWTAEAFMRPTWRSIDDTFEAWAYRNGLIRRLQILERQKLLEQRPAPDLGRVLRLTETGRRMALGGRDPLERWKRKWDGRWRIALFDLPAKATAIRMKMRRFLLDAKFGYLQQSAWVTPDSLEDTNRLVAKLPVDVESLTLFEGRPCGGESDMAIVEGAWDFDTINGLYETHISILKQCPEGPARGKPPGPAFLAWARRELKSWKTAVSRDPLLPQVLLPRGYAGGRSWQQRRELFSRLAANLQA